MPVRARTLCAGALCSALLAGCPPRPASPPATIPAILHETVLGGRPLRVEAYFDAGRTRGFLTVGLERGEWVSPTYPAWKATAGDVDGDGRPEVLLGVWSRRRRHAEPEPHRAVWVLGWDGRRLSPRWLGSALSRPLRDFVVGDVDGGGPDELVALEAGPGSCYLQAYRWTGFGFAGTAARRAECDLQLDAEARAVRVSRAGARYRLSARGAALELREEQP